jgi:2-oxoisovalerate dehydrogenase E1 component subunit alpha
VAPRAPEPHTLLAPYHTMLMARAIERRLWVLGRQEDVSTSFRGTGFEALQAAAAAALRPGVDWVVPCPLDLALCLAMGMPPLHVMLAVFGRASDPGSAGRQAPGAFGSRAGRILMTSAAAGRHVVQAAGIAYASKVSGRDEVTLVCTDLRGTYAGDWHEGINFAGVHALPLVFLVEDLAVGSRPIPQHTDALVARAEGYGLASEAIDGGDFGAATAALDRAVERARSKGGATLIHSQVVDLTSMAAGGGMLPPEQLEALARQDPIDRMRRRLMAAGALDDAADEQAQRDCARVVEAAVAEARLAPSPEGPRALDNVFSREERRG